MKQKNSSEAKLQCKSKPDAFQDLKGITALIWRKKINTEGSVQYLNKRRLLLLWLRQAAERRVSKGFVLLFLHRAASKHPVATQADSYEAGSEKQDST